MAEDEDYELPDSDDDMWAAIEGNRDDSISQPSTSTKVVPLSVPTAHLPSKVPSKEPLKDDGTITDDAEDSPTEDYTDEEYAYDEFLASPPESPVGIKGHGQADSSRSVSVLSSLSELERGKRSHSMARNIKQGSKKWDDSGAINRGINRTDSPKRSQYGVKQLGSVLTGTLDSTTSRGRKQNPRGKKFHAERTSNSLKEPAVTYSHRIGPSLQKGDPEDVVLLNKAYTHRVLQNDADCELVLREGLARFPRDPVWAQLLNLQKERLRRAKKYRAKQLRKQDVWQKEEDLVSSDEAELLETWGGRMSAVRRERLAPDRGRASSSPHSMPPDFSQTVLHEEKGERPGMVRAPSTAPAGGRRQGTSQGGRRIISDLQPMTRTVPIPPSAARPHHEMTSPRPQTKAGERGASKVRLPAVPCIVLPKVTHCAEEDVGTPTSPIVVFLNGPPLSGKTSISNFTTNYPGLQWVVLQADKLLREQKLKESSQPSKRTMTISHSHLVVWLLLAAIREHCGKDKPQCHFLVEGFPSTAKQWAIWEEATGPVKDSTKKTGAEGLFIRNPLQLYLSTPTVALEARALALLERGTIHVRERPTLLGPLKKRQLAYTNAHSVIKNLPNTRLIKTAHKTIEDVFEVVFGELVALQSAPPILAARAGQSALILCVIGSPCAGKTTQAALLARRFGCKQLRATLADGVHMPAGSDPALLAAWSVVMEAVDCVKAGAVPRADGVQSKRDSGGYWETGSGQVGKPADGNSMGESQEGKVESQIFVIDGSPGTFEELWAFQAATHGCALQEQQRGTPMGERVKINWLNVVLALPKAEARLRVEGVHGPTSPARLAEYDATSRDFYSSLARGELGAAVAMPDDGVAIVSVSEADTAEEVHERVVREVAAFALKRCPDLPRLDTITVGSGGGKSAESQIVTDDSGFSFAAVDRFDHLG